MAHKPLPESERFWRHVDVRGPDECWPWIGHKLKSGYGVFFFRGKTTTAHRVALVLSGERLNGGLNVLHACDNPPCCNPAHLSAGSQADNLSDMRAKGRGYNFPVISGERAPHAKLSDDQIATIRSEYAAGGVSQKVLAERYGVVQSHVSRIVRGENREIPIANG